MPIEPRQLLANLRRSHGELELEIEALLRELPRPIATRLIRPLAKQLAILAALIDLVAFNLEGKP